MAKNKELKTVGFIIRGEKKLKRRELSEEERSRLASNWNKTAMETAGYAPSQNGVKNNPVK